MMKVKYMKTNADYKTNFNSALQNKL